MMTAEEALLSLISGESLVIRTGDSEFKLDGQKVKIFDPKYKLPELVAPSHFVRTYRKSRFVVVTTGNV